MFELKVCERLWILLIDLKEKVDKHSLSIKHILFHDQQFSFNETLPEKQESLIGLFFDISDSLLSSFKHQFQLHPNLILAFNQNDNELVELLKLYGVFCVAKMITAKNPLVYVHVAQTLDGKIATECGHSKWIGNQGNLIHAHRIRALCDGILIGANTLKIDCPKLTVRHVKGKNPRKIVLTNSCDNFDSLKEDNDQDILVMRSSTYKTSAVPSTGVEYQFVESENGQMPPHQILSSMKSIGIHSILIEGGAFTISQFLQNKKVDYFQIHFAPIIFGSGKNAINLKVIDHVQEAIHLEHKFYTMVEDSVMLTGYLS